MAHLSSFEGAVPSSDIPASQQAASLAPTSQSAVVADMTPPASPAPVSPSASMTSRPSVTRSAVSFMPPAAQTARPTGSLYPPATLKGIDSDPNAGPATEWDSEMGKGDMVLELADGLALSGHSFGADKSVAGECVFQTGKAARPLCLSGAPC